MKCAALVECLELDRNIVHMMLDGLKSKATSLKQKMMIRIRTFGEMEIFTTNGLEGRRKKQALKYDKAGFKMNKQLRKDSR